MRVQFRDGAAAPPLNAVFGGRVGAQAVKQVFVAQDITEAHLVRGLLESYGLAVAVRGEDLWGTRGEVPFVDAWPTVWVEDDSREAEARAIVQRYESERAQTTAQGLAWRCTKCAEEVEPQFTICWNCGTDRPST